VHDWRRSGKTAELTSLAGWHSVIGGSMTWRSSFHCTQGGTAPGFKVLAEGSMTALRNDPRVIEVYLRGNTCRVSNHPNRTTKATFS
jgi:ABC-type uncharacterized transport system ATPase subunit